MLKFDDYAFIYMCEFGIVISHVKHPRSNNHNRTLFVFFFFMCLNCVSKFPSAQHGPLVSLALTLLTICYGFRNGILEDPK